MALDGIYLHTIKKEIQNLATDIRIEKIWQPSKETVIMSLRYNGGSSRLLISSGANNSRIHLTSAKNENPKSPPMFCMLLRKHLTGAKLRGIRQQGLDRILFLDFEATNQMGDVVFLTLVVEIMGRHSNIILIDSENKVIDSIKRVDLEMSSVRQILPALTYKLPPSMNKLNLFEIQTEEIIEKLTNQSSVTTLEKGLLSTLEGVSPIFCREVAFYATRGISLLVNELNDDIKTRLTFYLNKLKNEEINNTLTPCMTTDKSGVPKDFCFTAINQYGTQYKTTIFNSPSELLDIFYFDRDLLDKMRGRSMDLLKLLSSLSDRLERKLIAQKSELLESKKREQLKVFGNLLSANMYAFSKGDKTVKVLNFYEEGSPEIEIPISNMLTPAKNAQKYFSEYKKADNAEKMLIELIKNGEQELIYIDSVFEALSRAKTESELLEIRKELIDQKYLKNKMVKVQKEKPLEPKKYLSSDGLYIYVGRNNIQNDKLTLKTAKNYDVWFHTHNIPGAHVVIDTTEKEPPQKTIEQAAYLSAINSKAAGSNNIPVDYTIIKNVKKQPNSKPGMVNYVNYKTIYINPEDFEEKAEEIIPKN